MSGGTWDYQQHYLGELARDLFDPVTAAARGSRHEDELTDLPHTRELASALLLTIERMVKDMDYHFAGDSHYEDSDLMNKYVPLLREIIA